MTASDSSAPVAPQSPPSRPVLGVVRHCESIVKPIGGVRKCRLVSRHERSASDSEDPSEALTLFEVIATEFRAHRTDAGLTQRQVAKEWNVHRRTVINWEKTGEIPGAVCRWMEIQAQASTRGTGT